MGPAVPIRDHVIFDSLVRDRSARPKAPRVAKRPPMPFPPRGIESAYARKIKRLIAELQTDFTRELLAALPKIQAEHQKSLPEALRQDSSIEYISRLVGQLRILTGRLWTAQELEDLAYGQMEDTNELVKKSIQNQWKRVLGVNPQLNDRGLQTFLKERAKENAALISNIPAKQAASLESGILSAVQRGARVQEISEIIEERFGAMTSNAETIARTETGKVYSQLNQYRQKEAGLTRYRWATVGDDRVRDSHRALDGTLQSWDEPPLVDGEPANPGDQINCRCVALPVIE